MLSTSNTKTILIILSATITLAIAFYFISNAKMSFSQLKDQVKPTASLYPNTKSLENKLIFINDNKESVNLSDNNDKWTLLYFGYTSCPDVCPVDLAILSQTVNLMKHPEKLQVVFVSVDPKRDIGKLNDFVTKFNPTFMGLTAYEKELSVITRSLGVYHEIAKVVGNASMDHSKMDHSQMNHGDDYLVNHTASFLLLNPNSELSALLTNPHYADKLAEALDLIIENL